MRRTFCDRCGNECVNTVAHISGGVEHKTSQGQNVGYDEIKPKELCASCFASVQRMLDLTVVPSEILSADVPMENTRWSEPRPSTLTVPEPA